VAQFWRFWQEVRFARSPKSCKIIASSKPGWMRLIVEKRRSDLPALLPEGRIGI